MASVPLSVASLYAFLDGYTQIRAAGSQYEYSNLTMGLLGHARSPGGHFV
jgi:hypothetical protein